MERRTALAIAIEAGKKNSETYIQLIKEAAEAGKNHAEFKTVPFFVREYLKSLGYEIKKHCCSVGFYVAFTEPEEKKEGSPLRDFIMNSEPLKTTVSHEPLIYESNKWQTFIRDLKIWLGLIKPFKTNITIEYKQRNLEEK